MLNELSIKLKLWKMGYPLLPIKEESLNLYKRAVKNNSNESDFLARCKLSRNWYCSTKEKVIGNVTWRYYGNLAIGMRDGVIAKIHNKEGIYDLHIDRDIKRKINEVIEKVNVKKVA